MMTLIDHPEEYMTGTRVLLLKSRNKDGLKSGKSMTLLSNSVDDFQQSLVVLSREAKEGQRIYASASSRNIKVAARNIKQAMLENDYNQFPDSFYNHLYTRWVSALMQVNAQAEKNWIFDCDTVPDITQTHKELSELYIPFYSYNTKSGVHFVTKPFNTTLLSQNVQLLKHVNPLMLWGY